MGAIFAESSSKACREVTVPGGRETLPPVRFRGGQVSERGGAEGTPSAEFSVLILLKKTPVPVLGCGNRLEDGPQSDLLSGSSVFKLEPAVSQPYLPKGVSEKWICCGRHRLKARCLALPASQAACFQPPPVNSYLDIVRFGL